MSSAAKAAPILQCCSAPRQVLLDAYALRAPQRRPLSASRCVSLRKDLPQRLRRVRDGDRRPYPRIELSVSLEGNLTDEQHARLQEIAHKCPVHKTLNSEIVITDV